MEPPYSFEPLIIFGFLSIMLLVGIALRTTIPLIQKYLFPSCLVGGMIGMVLLNLKLVDFKFDDIEMFAFHLFNISFISVGLTGNEKKEEEENLSDQKEIAKGASWMSLVQGICFPMQAVIGGLTVLVFGVLGIELFSTFGFLCPLGFNEGPGQALTFGKVWEGNGFENASTIGVTFASVGFFFSFFVGVPLANWGLRKNLAAHGKKELSPELITGIMQKDKEYESAGNITVHSGNVDNLAFQAGLIGMVYIITYLLVKGLGIILGGDLAKDLWGFFFFFGLFISVIVKWIIDKIGFGYLVDPGIQRRITGWSVDFLIVAVVTAIEIAAIWAYIIPISIICLISGVSTTLVVLFFGRRLWENNLERTLAIYGSVTGTVASGLLLLRIVDPDFKTTAAKELGFMNIIVVPFILTGLILVKTPVTMGISIVYPMLAFIAMIILSLTILKVTKFWGEKKF